MQPHFETLEFPAILAKLKDLAVSEDAKQALEALEPAMNEQVCAARMAETTAARRVLDAFGAPPLPVMSRLNESQARYHRQPRKNELPPRSTEGA